MTTTRRDLCKLLALAPVAAVLHEGKQARPYDIERRRTLHRDYSKYGIWVSREERKFIVAESAEDAAERYRLTLGWELAQDPAYWGSTPGMQASEWQEWPKDELFSVTTEVDTTIGAVLRSYLPWAKPNDFPFGVHDLYARAWGALYEGQGVFDYQGWSVEEMVRFRPMARDIFHVAEEGRVFGQRFSEQKVEAHTMRRLPSEWVNLRGPGWSGPKDGVLQVV